MMERVGTRVGTGTGTDTDTAAEVTVTPWEEEAEGEGEGPQSSPPWEQGIQCGSGKCGWRRAGPGSARTRTGSRRQDKGPGGAGNGIEISDAGK